MAIPMRLNTSGNILIGPFIKSTDGYTVCTGLTSADMVINFTHMGATATGDMSTWDHTGNQLISTELAGGYYVFALSSNPLSKQGRVRIDILPTSCLPSWEEIQVYPANVYDSLYAASGVDMLQVDISEVAGATVNSTKPWHQTSAQGFKTDTSQTVLSNMVQMASQALTTAAGDNFNYLFNNGGVDSTQYLSYLSTFTTALTVLSNMVQMASQALTTDAGANFANFFFNNDVVSTERVGDIPTTADILTTSDIMEANMVAMASYAMTTDAADNFENFFFNNDAVSTVRLAEISDLSTFTTALTVLSNMVQLASYAMTTDAGDNFENFFFNNDVVSTVRLSNVGAAISTLTSFSIGAIAGSTAQITSGMFNVNVDQVAGSTVTGPITTDSNLNVSAIGGATVNTTLAQLGVNVVKMADVAFTTDAGDNIDNYFFDNDAVSTKRLSDGMTVSTVTPLNVGAISSIAVTTQAGANWQLFFNVGGAVTTAVLTDVPTTGDILTTSDKMEANMVAMASQALTTDAGDNFNYLFNNGGVDSTQYLSYLSTMTSGNTLSSANTLSTSDIMEANVVAVSSQALTTEAGANFNYFYDNNSVASTERVSDLPTTADLLTTSKVMESNMVKVASQALTTQGGANWATYIDNGDAASTAQLGAQSTFGMLDTVDGMTVLQYMQYDQAYITGDISVVGAATNQFVYDKFGGTTFFSHTITTKTRTFTSN